MKFQQTGEEVLSSPRQTYGEVKGRKGSERQGLLKKFRKKCLWCIPCTINNVENGNDIKDETGV